MARTKAHLTPSITAMITAYHQALAAAGIPVTQLILFGSHAKGTAHQWSDIDLAVVSPDFGRDYHDERVRLMRMSERISTAIEPHPLHPHDLNDRWSTLAAELRQHGIPMG